MAENPGGDRQEVKGGVKSPQGIDTPGVYELPQGDKTPGVATKGESVLGEDSQGQGGDGTPPPHLSNQGERIEQRRRGHDARARDGGTAKRTAGHGEVRQYRAPSKAFRRRQWRQTQKRHALAPRVWHNGIGGAGRRSSHRGDPSKLGHPQCHKGGRQTRGGRRHRYVTIPGSARS